MDDLIARLEAADKGSAELDAIVVAHLVNAEVKYVERAGCWCLYRDGNDRAGNARLWSPVGRIEHELCRMLANDRGPTRSLDAALTLVPEGFGWSVGTRDRGAWKMKPEEPEVYFSDVTQHYGIEVVDTVSSSPALALCIAALKARNIQAKQK